eukprot:scaffold2652_cov322-Pavlova_lutheri.AAC.1
MTDPAHINGVPNLNGENWKEWFFMMENHVVLNGLWEVTKDNPIEEEKKEEEKKEEKTKQKMNSAKIRILNTISMDYVDNVMHCTTPHELWMAIKAIYQETGYLRERSLKAALSRFKKYPDQSIEQYMNKLVQIVNELKPIGVTTLEKDVITIALNGLPANYNNLTTVVDHMTVTLTLAEIKISLVHEEVKLNLNVSYMLKEASPVKLADKNKVQCQYYKKLRHILDDCWQFQKDYGKLDTKRSMPKSKGKYKGNKPLNTIRLMALAAELETTNQQNKIIDSGASWHMTRQKDILKVTTIEVFGFAKIFFSLRISPRFLTVGSPEPKRIFFFRKTAPISELFWGLLRAFCSETGGGVGCLYNAIRRPLHVL